MEDDEREPSGVPSLTALRVDDEVTIDGRLREAVWESAPTATRFVQGEPIEGAPATADTRVSVLFDETALYVGVRLFERDPARIGGQLVRRDEPGQYDYFEIALDPNNDRRTGYLFRVSAAGVQRDVYLYNDTQQDDNWDAVWESAVAVDTLGWSAELRIPLSQLRYDAADSSQSWGVNFTRRRLAANERSYFVLESRERHGKVSVFGRLQGLTLPTAGRRIEIQPYALSRANTGPYTAGDPFFDGTHVGAQVGVGVRYGIGSSFTLDMTVNPDFGQVEVDPAVINLSAFETFFPEKRPFFVEDGQIFDFSLAGRQNRLFYSRRIGREPQGNAPDEADFSDVPNQTTILTAAKLTGRTQGGLSIGALAAVTGRETGSAYYGGEDRFENFTVEPRSQYGVGRLTQDFRNGGTQIGAIVTGTHRELPNDGTFDYLPSSAYSAGLDFEHNWGGPNARDWVLDGYAATSMVYGSPEALLRRQLSSNHYFQRPDATRFSVDSSATAMSGVDWRLQLERQSARHWTGSVWIGQLTPGFEINDLGFSGSTERLDAGARLSYREIRPGALFRDYRIDFFTFHNWRHEALDDALSPDAWGRAHKNGQFSLSGDFTFLNYWDLNLRAEYSPATMSDGATRGGPLMVDPASHSFSVRAGTDRRAPVFVQPRVEWRDEAGGGYRFQTSLEMNLRPAPSWELELQPRYTIERSAAQYVTTTDDVGYAPTYGARYLFADLERRSLSLQTRFNVAFTPHLTLQLFAQPLLSSGDYVTYKQLVRAESFAFDEFATGTAVTSNGTVACAAGRICRDGVHQYLDFDGDGATDFRFEDRDFNVRSLRLNAVLRWEYRPGSTVFLVWQQGRRGSLNAGTFDVGRDVGDLLRLPAENTFILKFNYWLGL